MTLVEIGASLDATGEAVLAAARSVRKRRRPIEPADNSSEADRPLTVSELSRGLAHAPGRDRMPACWCRLCAFHFVERKEKR